MIRAEPLAEHLPTRQAVAAYAVSTNSAFLGRAASLLAMNLMTSLLFEVRSWDIPTLSPSSSLLPLLLASSLPAKRAARVNAADALRSE